MAANSSHMLAVRGVRLRLLLQPVPCSVDAALSWSSSVPSSAMLSNLPPWCDCARDREIRGSPG